MARSPRLSELLVQGNPDQRDLVRGKDGITRTRAEVYARLAKRPPPPFSMTYHPHQGSRPVIWRF